MGGDVKAFGLLESLYYFRNCSVAFSPSMGYAFQYTDQ